MSEYIIPGVFTVIVAIVEFFAAKDRKKASEDRTKTDRREADRAEESRLSMQMMDASIALGVATAIAVEENKLNGEMKAAKKKAQAAQDEYEAFTQKLAARQLAKR